MTRDQEFEAALDTLRRANASEDPKLHISTDELWRFINETLAEKARPQAPGTTSAEAA